MLSEALGRLVIDSSDPDLNLSIAFEYESLGQAASAVGFYIRTVEVSYRSAPLVTYAALLRMSLCIEGCAGPDVTVAHSLLQAIAFLPGRPEGYYHVSRLFQRCARWPESYAFASMGLRRSHDGESLPMAVDFPGIGGLLSCKATSAWWMGRKQEAEQIAIGINDMLG